MPAIRRQEKQLRGLGRVVGYKAKTTGSEIEQQYKDKGYVVEKEGNKFTRIYKPAKMFTKYKEKRGSTWDTKQGSFIPHEFIFDKDGNLVKEVTRDTYQKFKSYKGNKLKEYLPYEQDVKTYSDGYLTRQDKYNEFIRPSSKGNTARGHVKLEESKRYKDGYLVYSKDISYNTYGQKQHYYEKDYASGKVKEKGYSPIVTSFTQKGITPITRKPGEDTVVFMKRRGSEEQARKKLIQSGVSVADINKFAKQDISAVQLRSEQEMFKTPTQLSKVFTGTKQLAQTSLSPQQVEQAVKFGVLKPKKEVETAITKGVVQVGGGGKFGDEPVKVLKATKELMPGITITGKYEPKEKDVSAITGMGVLDKPTGVWSKILGSDIVRKRFIKKPEDSKIKITIGDPQMPISTAKVLPRYIDGMMAIVEKPVYLSDRGEQTITRAMYTALDPTQAEDYVIKIKDSKVTSMIPTGHKSKLAEGAIAPLRKQWEDEKRTYIEKRIAEDEAKGIDSYTGLQAITGGTVMEQKKSVGIGVLPPQFMPPSPLDVKYDIPKVELRDRQLPIDTKGIMTTDKKELFKETPERLDLARRIGELNLSALKAKEESLLGVDKKELLKIKKEREKLEFEIGLLYPKVNAEKIITGTEGDSIKDISIKLQEIGRLEGRPISIVEKGAAEREITLDMRYKDLEKRELGLKSKFAIIELEDKNLRLEDTLTQSWKTGRIKEIEELRVNLDVTNKKDTEKFNVIVENFKKEDKLKVMNLKNKRKIFIDKYGSYKSVADEAQLEFDEYKKDVDVFNKEVEERKVMQDKDDRELKKIEAKHQNKFYEQKAYYRTPDVVGTSVQPTYVSQLKEMKSDFMPKGVFSDKPFRSDFEKSEENINSLRTAYNEKYMPVNKIRISELKDIYDFGIKEGFMNVDTAEAFKLKSDIDSGALKVVVKGKTDVRPGEIHVSDVRKIIGESGVPLRQTIERDTTFEQLKNIPTEPFQKRRTDDILIQNLQNSITRAEEIKAGKRALTVGALTLTTAAIPGVLKTVAALKTPVLKYTAGLAAKGALSKPGQAAAMGLFGYHVGKETYEGVKERDVDKLVDVGVEVAGVGAGMAWYMGTGGKPFTETFRKPWTASQLQAYKTPYGKVWKPGKLKPSMTVLKGKAIRGVSIQKGLAKKYGFKGETIVYDPVSPRQYEPFVKAYDTTWGKFKYTKVTPEEAIRLEKGGYDISFRPVDTQLTFSTVSARTPRIADLISQRMKGPIKGLEIVEKGYDIEPSKQIGFLNRELVAEKKGLGVIEYWDAKVDIGKGVSIKNPRTNLWEKYNQDDFILKRIQVEKFGYEKPYKALTNEEELVIKKLSEPIDKLAQKDLKLYQQQTPSTIKEILNLHNLEIISTKKDGSLIIKGQKMTGRREVVVEEIPAKDPRNTKIIDELVVRAGRPYKSDMQGLAERIQLDRITQQLQAKKLVKDERAMKIKEAREKAIKDKKTFAEQPVARQVTVTETEKLQKFKESYPGEQLQKAIIEADPHSISGARTYYQVEPQYKGVRIGEKYGYAKLEPMTEKLMKGEYIHEPLKGKIFFERAQILRQTPKLAEKLDIKQKTELIPITIPEVSQLIGAKYIQQQIIPPREKGRVDEKQDQDTIVIPDIDPPVILQPAGYQPFTPVQGMLRPIKMPIISFGGGGFWPNASGGYGSGRAVKQWTVTNALKNIQGMFMHKQKLKMAKALEKRRKKALPQQAADRMFKPIQKLDENKIKMLMGRK